MLLAQPRLGVLQIDNFDTYTQRYFAIPMNGAAIPLITGEESI